MGPGEWVGLALGVIALGEAFRRALRRPVRAFRHFLHEARNAVYDIRGVPEIRDPRTGNVIQARTPGIADRMRWAEKELKPNGGASLRDSVDRILRIAAENKESNTRLEGLAHDAVVTAGQAAMIAETAAQGLDEFRTEQRQNHAQNLSRLSALEETDRASATSREFLLGVLKHQYDIDLLPDEDAPDEEA